MELIFHDVICSLSSSLDLIGSTKTHHGKRTALMAASMAKNLEWGNQMELDMLYATMLHDCGISTTEGQNHFLSELEWEDVQAHCDRGAQYFIDCPFFGRYAPWVLHHHTHWDELKNLELPEIDKLAANLIFLVDSVDALQVKYVDESKVDSNILLKKSYIMDEILSLSDTIFSPVLVDIFLVMGKREAFWLAQDPCYIDASVKAYCKFSEKKTASFPMLRSIAMLFSKFIDAKSPYTKEHSKYVAILSRYLAKQLGFSKEEQQHIELSGMLHDLGKLRVPNYILDKQAPLNEYERACMLRHSFDTMQLLKTVFPDTKIAEWAGNHHESLSGNGYPFHFTDLELDLGSRIVAVADIFQALIQKRPYRDSLNLSQIKSIMDNLVSGGQLDGTVVAILEQNYDACYYLAQRPEPLH